MTFNAKNLSYEAKEPAFLRKLRGEYGGGDSARHRRPLARPRKTMRDGDEDYQPTYIVGDSQDTLSKAEYEALVKQSGVEEEGANDPYSSPGDDCGAKRTAGAMAEKDMETDMIPPAREHVAAIGGSTKRKVAKVVGDDEDEETKSNEKASVQQSNQPKQAKGKKAKKVKLSFDDDANDSQ